MSVCLLSTCSLNQWSLSFEDNKKRIQKVSAERRRGMTDGGSGKAEQISTGRGGGLKERPIDDVCAVHLEGEE